MWYIFGSIAPNLGKRHFVTRRAMKMLSIVQRFKKDEKQDERTLKPRYP